MAKLLSGNEALALGAYRAGVKVAAAYPGTPSSEILETLAKFKDIYAEWSVNEKVAMEVAMGACYAGARALVSMKQVGLNVASDPFMAVSTTGVNAGLVVISADDPGIHSSQDEQDNRHYAPFAKVPMLEPSDSQEACEFMALAYDMSERFDTPVLVRTTTRVSHSKSVVRAIPLDPPFAKGERLEIPLNPPLRKGERGFRRDLAKYVMLPTSARMRRPLIEERLVNLAGFAETVPVNQVFSGDPSLGIVTSGIAYQYAREVFPKASFLKLGMTYPLPRRLIADFAATVDRLLVIEELDPFLEQAILAMGIRVAGKEFVPRTGELNPGIIEEAAHKAGLLKRPRRKTEPALVLPKRPPLLCAGCPHAATFFVLSTLGQRARLPGSKSDVPGESGLVITGDIGCYTLGAYPPYDAMDTCGCMGASIGAAMGMEKAGIKRKSKVVAVIGDSTFMHSGITPLVNAVYNQGKITVIILDNSTTAMTGHQPHPGTGVSAQGQPTQAVYLESLIRGMGVSELKVVNAFDIREIRSAIRNAVNSDQLSVVIARGACSVRLPGGVNPRAVDDNKCDQCGVCILIGCPAIRTESGEALIEGSLCVGDPCGLCESICPKKAIGKVASSE
ncbi:MAG: indolepyruvate ferredoxin oxidoreductase subunit alpha [Chloroflexi bacterium]|nr:indolepyruvate ferredoxin oxidoreductase subunit alpha [Chloroflexota bacterium]